jgi:hypothetical protein
MTDDRDASLGFPPRSQDTAQHVQDATAIRLDELATSFEQAWRTGPEPNIDEFPWVENVPVASVSPRLPNRFHWRKILL